ncbi:MAG: ATP-binding protein [Candidatus Kapabacteria bacterium]|nr:ATP-binding protein [Candidatus Kapabacteria bacterium]
MIKLKYFTFYIFLLSILCFNQKKAFANEQKNVLIINSYHSGNLWSDSEEIGLLRELHTRNDNLNIFIEFLDAKHFPDFFQESDFFNLLKAKYNGIKLSLIIVIDNPALDFMLERRKHFFFEVPIVFCGINGYTKSMLKDESAITGVAEILGTRKTIELMRKIHPDVNEILIVNDYTKTGKLTMSEAQNQIQSINDIKISFIDNLPVKELITKLKSMPATSLVLLLSYSVDSESVILDNNKDYSSLIESISSVPVYAVHNERIGSGIIGGYMLSGTDHGKRAGEIASEILHGKNPDNIQVDTNPDFSLILDYNQLLSKHIALNNIPENAIVRNKPISIYQKYWLYIWITIFIVVILIVAVFVLLLNIIKRRITEDKLKEAKDHYLNIFENAQEGIFHSRIDGKLLQANKSFAKLIGYDNPIELLNDNSFNTASIYVDHCQRNRFLDSIKFENEVKAFVFEAYKKDGSRIWIYEDAHLVGDFSSPDAFLEGFTIDITQTVNSQQEIYKSEQKYRSLFESMSEGVALHEIIHDSYGTPIDYRIIDTNQQFETILGIKREFAKGKLATELYQTEKPLYFTEFLSVAESGKPLNFEVYNESFSKYFKISAFSNEKGSFATVFSDITLQKDHHQEIERVNRELENRIIERTEELNLALESVEQSNEELKILNISLAEESIKLHDAYDILEQKDIELEKFNSILEKKVLDRTNELLDAKLKLEDVSNLKSIVINNLGHELRTPLNGILGFASLLKKETEDSEQLEFVNLIFSSAVRLKNTLNSILALTELETGASKLFFEAIHLPGVIENFTMLMQEEANSHNLKLYALINDEKTFAKLDEYLLQQILFNLTDNAIKFTRTGEIQIILDSVIENNQNLVMIKIKDTGIGISERNLKTIFEPFRQVSEGLNRSHEGVGLGLTITQKMVELLEGQIQIESIDSVGTTVILLFNKLEM